MLDIVWKACDGLDKGKDVDPTLFVGAAEFFKSFADKCHHSKEEKLLFEKMIARGVSRTSGPIAVMLTEHEDGRAYVKKIAELSGRKLTQEGKKELIGVARGYVNLLSAHIEKEDNILYPMADNLLSEEDQEELERGFEGVERDVMGPGVHEKYHKMIEKWERKYG